MALDWEVGSWLGRMVDVVLDTVAAVRRREVCRDIVGGVSSSKASQYEGLRDRQP